MPDRSISIGSDEDSTVITWFSFNRDEAPLHVEYAVGNLRRMAEPLMPDLVALADQNLAGWIQLPRRRIAHLTGTQLARGCQGPADPVV